ncbi:MAG: DNA polymerase III subunit delta [Bacteroidia bacterium]
MAIKSYDEIKRDIRNKIYSPIYLLQGDEPYYIDQLSDLLEQSVLDEMEKEFNQTVAYGKDIDLVTLAGSAKRYPMMSNYQVVMIKEAQDIKGITGKDKEDEDAKGGKDKDNNPLLNYALQPLSSTVLVLCMKYKSLDKRGKLYKAIEKNGIVFESKKLYDDKLPRWIEVYLSDKKHLIQPKAAVLMAEHLGNDLSRIANECDKLLINLKPGETIDVRHIEENIGISKEFNIFELQKSLGQRDVLTSSRIVNYFRDNPKSNPLPLTFGNLYSFFAKLMLYHSLTDKSKTNVASALKINPFFVDDYVTAARNYSPAKLVEIIGYLREYDLKSKGVGSSSAEPGELVREMVYKIMH